MEIWELLRGQTYKLDTSILMDSWFTDSHVDAKFARKRISTKLQDKLLLVCARILSKCNSASANSELE